MPSATDDPREVGPADTKVGQLTVVEEGKLMGKPRPPAPFAEPGSKPQPPGTSP